MSDPEDTGLHADNLARCDLVAGVIETPGPLPSLNLAQAVAIALWGLSRPDASPPVRGGATHAELEALINRAFATLNRVGCFATTPSGRRRASIGAAMAGAGLDKRGAAGATRRAARNQSCAVSTIDCTPRT